MAAEKQKNSSNTPGFLARAGLRDGEWMSCSKLSIRVLMRPEIFALKVNVLGAVMLQSFGYATELGVAMRNLRKHERAETVDAVKVVDGKVTQIITAARIGEMIVAAGLDGYKESGVKPKPEQIAALKKSKHNIRRMIQELEEDGALARARVNCHSRELADLSYDQAVSKKLLTPLSDLSDQERGVLSGHSGGRVAIFLRAKPKPAKTYGQRGVNLDPLQGLTPNDCNADSPMQLLLQFMRNHSMRKLIAHAGEVASREDVRAAVLAYKELTDAAAQSLKTYLVQAIEAAKAPGKPQPAPPLQLPVLAAPTPPAANGTGQITRSQLSPGADIVAGPTPIPPAQATAGKPGRSPGWQGESQADVALVLDGMRHFCRADEDAARSMLTQCRAKFPHSTAVEVCEAIKVKGRLARDKDNPVGFLLTAVPRMFSAPLIDERRQTKEVYTPDPNLPDSLGQAKEWLADPKSSDARRRNARAMVTELEAPYARKAGA
jgi:hypothetical protein